MLSKICLSVLGLTDYKFILDPIENGPVVSDLISEKEMKLIFNKNYKAKKFRQAFKKVTLLNFNIISIRVSHLHFMKCTKNIRIIQI